MLSLNPINFEQSCGWISSHPCRFENRLVPQMDFGVLFFYSRFGRVNAEKMPLETNGGKNGEDGKKRRIYFGIARHIPYIEEWEGRMIGYREAYMQSAYLHIYSRYSGFIHLYLNASLSHGLEEVEKKVQTMRRTERKRVRERDSVEWCFRVGKSTKRQMRRYQNEKWPISKNIYFRISCADAKLYCLSVANFIRYC